MMTTAMATTTIRTATFQAATTIFWIDWRCPIPRKLSSTCLILSPGGSEGLFAQKTLEITDSTLSTYKNQDGYDLLGRTKDQIRTTEQVNAALAAQRRARIHKLRLVKGAAKAAEELEKCDDSYIFVTLLTFVDLCYLMLFLYVLQCR